LLLLLPLLRGLVCLLRSLETTPWRLQLLLLLLLGILQS
jgi:hypothetical protein